MLVVVVDPVAVVEVAFKDKDDETVVAAPNILLPVLLNAVLSLDPIAILLLLEILLL